MPIRKFLLLLTFSMIGCFRAANPSANCPAIPGLDAVVKPGALVVFGEIHGTHEIPKFVGDAACAASRRARVHVGLELPTEDTKLLEIFLAGQGDEGLRESKIWRSQSPYGVTSRAMLGLLQRIRDYRRAGAPIEVFFFDDRARSGVERRDEGMAEHISRERDRARDDIYLVEVGNYHARKTVGARWDPAKRWMANFLAGREQGLVTLDLRSLGGTAWTCMQKVPGGPEVCGGNPIKGNNASATSSDRAVRLEPNRDLGYDGVFVVGAITASLPAFPP